MTSTERTERRRWPLQLYFALPVTVFVVAAGAAAIFVHVQGAARPGIRVLFSSGYPADTILRHGIAEESAAYIEKPYLPDDLARAIRELLAAEPAI